MMKLFRPDRPKDFTMLDAQRYLSNFFIELEEISFTSAERHQLMQTMIGKLVEERTRPFFFYHFCPLFVQAVHDLFCQTESPLIVDLGCASASASILFALLGAKVVGIDLDPVSISACRKRKAFYEAEFGPLDIEFHAADVFKFDYEQVAPVDGIYSLFAFNLMQPSQELLARLIPILKPKGRLVISDGNRSNLYGRVFRPRPSLTPSEMQSALSAHHCAIITLEFDCTIPPALARIHPVLDMGLKVESVLDRLGLMRWLGVSYTVVAERNGV
jgi:SAM-dependent methyltransferase